MNVGKWDVLGFGAVAVDDLITVDQYPLPGSKIPVRHRQRQGGGLAGTALVAAARLGATAAYCGVLGDDELSRFTRREFEREGVDCTPVLYDPDARPIHSLVIVDRSTGDRTILFSTVGVREPALAEVTPELLSRSRLVFVDHTLVETGAHIVELAHAQGIPVLGDFEAVRDRCVLALLPRIDHLIVGTAFAAEVTGEREPAAMARALGGPDRACCVVTAGGQGCWYVERGGQVHHFPAFRVEVVDTTGCGDVFHGAYAACIARGQSVRRAIAVATAAAGLKATQPGGRSGIPDLPTVERFLREQGHDEQP
ncbi:MAG: PfkB family carbohydrate kinase [Anaerolineae bacterium]|nr:PfkB family carbohydrate kinase [Anaerolineae bacterium]